MLGIIKYNVTSAKIRAISGTFNEKISKTMFRASADAGFVNYTYTTKFIKTSPCYWHELLPQSSKW